MNERKRLQRAPMPVVFAGVLLLSAALLNIVPKLGISTCEVFLSVSLSTIIFLIYAPIHEFLHSFPLKKFGYKCKIYLSLSPLKAYTFCDDPIPLNHFRWSLVFPFASLLFFSVPVFFLIALTPFWLFSMLTSLSLCVYGSITDLWQLAQTINYPSAFWVANTRVDIVVFEDRDAALLHIEKTMKKEYS